MMITVVDALDIKCQGSITNIITGRNIDKNDYSRPPFSANLTRPKMYYAAPNSAIPLQYQLGFWKEQKNTSSISMTVNTPINLAAVDLTAGVWMIHGGSICFWK